MRSLPSATQTEPARYHRGDWVTVRNADQILATLDTEGRLDGLPFMPEMAGFCGGTYAVLRRVNRTCVEGAGMRAMDDTVLLRGVRCNGASHEGCQRNCLMFWKEAWLKPAVTANPSGPDASEPIEALSQLMTTKGDQFYCQSTELLGATRDLLPAEIRYYWQDWKIGETTLPRLLYVIWVQFVNKIWQHLWRVDYYRQPTGWLKKTESAELNLQAGELVEVKSFEEIKATLDTQGRNRGLRFETEMARYCGRRFRVAQSLRRAIAEKTGKMIELKNTVTLEGLTCEGICVRNCPRANYFWWRDIWLTRVASPVGTQPAVGVPSAEASPNTGCSLEMSAT